MSQQYPMQPYGAAAAPRAALSKSAVLAWSFSLAAVAGFVIVGSCWSFTQMGGPTGFVGWFYMLLFAIPGTLGLVASIIVLVRGGSNRWWLLIPLLLFFPIGPMLPLMLSPLLTQLQ